MISFQEIYNREELLNFIEHIFITDFVREIRQVSLTDSGRIKNAFLLGRSTKLGIEIFEFEHEGSTEKRATLTKEAFNILNKHAIYKALAVFHSKDTPNWRFSLMTATLKANVEGGIEKVLSNPKRYSFFLGPQAKVKTPTRFLIDKGSINDLNDLKGRFSIEVVNREFYNEISELFIELIGGEVSRKRKKQSFKSLLSLPDIADMSKQAQEFAVRLIGRIIFCWFLKEKHDGMLDSLMPQTLLSSLTVTKHKDYYHNVLEPIFFEVLNKPIKSRKYDYSLNEFTKIPYLNGGLFSPHDDDFYGNTLEKRKHVIVPNEWIVKLFKILETYNFTIDENTGYDEELSIDPEMLGRIFENLLAEINPDTGESARKSTGSYYTPREVVDYMINESLLQYLNRKTEIDNNKLRALLSYDLNDDLIYPISDKEKIEIINVLEPLKILDPACGSGAYPIGALQKIVFILQQIDPKGQLWFQAQIKNIPIELRYNLERENIENNFDYIRKLGVIRENIYGVDIQPIATEISRLRCFLTLIVDQKIDDNKDNRGIDPLPNLDFKFVTANALIGLPKITDEISMFEDTDSILKLKDIRNEYFGVKDGFDREQLKSKFKDIQKQMALNIFKGSYSGLANLTEALMNWDPFKHNISSWFDMEWMFGINNGFDIVIANPPYVFTRKMDFRDSFKAYVKEKYLSKIKNSHLKTKSTQSGKINLFGLFIIRAVELLVDQGQMIYITPNTLLRTTTYDLIRKFMLDNTEIKKIIDLGEGIFNGITASTIVIQLLKNTTNRDDEIEVISKIRDISNLQFSSSKVSQKSFIENISYGFNTSTNSNIDKIFKKIELNNSKLGKYCKDIIEGIVAHKHLISSEWKTGAEALLEGKDISAYMIKEPSNWIDWTSDKIHRRRPNYLWENSRKIVIQRISGGSTPITAALDDKKQKTFASINNLILKDEYVNSYPYILGVLNSKLINYYYANKFSNNSKLTVNISKTFLEAIPVSITGNAYELEIAELVERILSIEKRNDGHLDYLKIIELREIIDQKVYSVYQLSNDEIKLIES